MTFLKPLTLADLATLVYMEGARRERCADPLVPGEDLVTVDVAHYALPDGYESLSVDWACGVSLVFEPVWREEVPDAT